MSECPSLHLILFGSFLCESQVHPWYVQKYWKPPLQKHNRTLTRLQGSLQKAVTVFNKACPCRIIRQKELTPSILLFFFSSAQHCTITPVKPVSGTWGVPLVCSHQPGDHLDGVCLARSWRWIGLHWSTCSVDPGHGLSRPPQTGGGPGVINLPSLERTASSLGLLFQAIFLASSWRRASQSQHPRMISGRPGPV